MAKAKKAHYVDNKQLYAVMVEYKKAVDEAEQTGDIKPQVPNYVGRCLLQIANRLATKPNFANYTFKDDMISDGIENCVSYIHNFDPEKSNNPFAYFTQIIYYAFLRRIQKEKKQLYIKYKTIQDQHLLSDNVELSEHDQGSFNVETLSEDQKAGMYEFMNSFEVAKKKKTTKKVSNSLAAFVAK